MSFCALCVPCALCEILSRIYTLYSLIWLALGDVNLFAFACSGRRIRYTCILKIRSKLSKTTATLKLPAIMAATKGSQFLIPAIYRYDKTPRFYVASRNMTIVIIYSEELTLPGQKLTIIITITKECFYYRVLYGKQP